MCEVQKKSSLWSKIVDLLKFKINDINKIFDVEVLNVERDIDHHHLIFISKTNIGYSKICQHYQNKLFNRNQKKFVHLKKTAGKNESLRFGFNCQSISCTLLQHPGLTQRYDLCQSFLLCHLYLAHSSQVELHRLVLK